MEDRKSNNRFRITSIIIAAVMGLIIIVSLGIMPSISQSVSANPGPWEDFLAQMTFTKEPDNPLMEPTLAWESDEIGDYTVLEEATRLNLYYTGFNYDTGGGPVNGIGLATSPLAYPPTVWTKHSQIFAPNATPAQWDSGFVRLGTVFKVSSTYYMYYTGTPDPGFAGGAKIGLATSSDGENFTAYASNPVLTISGAETYVEDPAVIRMDATHWYMYYSYRQGGNVLPGIRVATSTDGITWTKVGDVLALGTYPAWDSQYIEHSNVYYIESHYVLLYEGYGGSGLRPWQIGLAYSTDPLATFTKFTGNPILSPSEKGGTFDEYHVDTASFFYKSGVWYMFFGGGDSYNYGPSRWAMGIAYSPGGTPASTPPSTYIWNASAPGDADVAGNWLPVGLPKNTDNIVFNSTSTFTCTFDLLGRFGSITMSPGAGIVYLATSFWVGEFHFNGGTLQTTLGLMIVSENFTRTNGTLSSGYFNVLMANKGGVFDTGPGAGDTFNAGYLNFKHNTTIEGDWARSQGWLIIQAGATVSIASGSHLVWDTWTGSWENLGTITGPGEFVYSVYTDVASFALSGVITAPVEFSNHPSMAANRTVTLASNTIFLSSILVKSGIGANTKTITLDLSISNYTLTADGITIGTLGAINPRSSWINDSGDWDSSDGSFTQGSSKLYMTGGRSGNTLAAWSAVANGSLTFTIPNLEEGAMYGVLVDGERKYTFTANVSNSISFTYSGPWSEHQFKVIETVLTQQVSVLVNLVFLMFAVGIIVGVIAEGTSSLRKMQMRTTEQMVKSLLNMVVYIIIGMASLGILYSIVA